MSDIEFRDRVVKAQDIILGLNDAIRTIADFCESQHKCEDCILCSSFAPDRWRCRFTNKTPEEWEVIS